MITEINGKKLDFHQLIEHSITAKFIIRKNEIVYANKASLRLLGLNHPSEILNQRFTQFLHPDEHRYHDYHLLQIYQKKESIESVETKVINSDGDIIEVQSTYGVYEFEGETLAQIILQDITDRKKAFINFIKNGIEAAPTHGRMIIRVENAYDFMTITISDNGCGITPDQLLKLGTSFHSTKENGTGLGLMVTYNIIKNHRGQILVESAVDEGTTFIIKLPVHKN